MDEETKKKINDAIDRAYRSPRPSGERLDELVTTLLDIIGYKK